MDFFSNRKKIKRKKSFSQKIVIHKLQKKQSLLDLDGLLIDLGWIGRVYILHRDKLGEKILLAHVASNRVQMKQILEQGHIPGAFVEKIHLVTGRHNSAAVLQVAKSARVLVIVMQHLAHERCLCMLVEQHKRLDQEL